MPSPVDIAFITVNYNTCTLVRDLADFFATAQLPFSHRLVVVDNDSRDGSHEYLTTRSDIDYIPAGENLGYGRAINRGMRESDSRYVCILNTDVILNAGSLSRLWEFMEQNPQVGWASPRIANRDGSTQGFIFYRSQLSNLFPLINRIRTSMLKRKLARSTSPLRVDGVLGAFFLARRSLAPDGCLFDEDFFFYFEDTELAHRLSRAGVPCYALPDCTVVHFGGSSTSLQGARQFYRSKRLYLTKQYGSAFASLVLACDRLRLRGKHLKYCLLGFFLPSKKVAEKREYYSVMRSAGDF